jgi:hypothetical protein
MHSERLSVLEVQAEEIRLNYLKSEIELGLEFARISTTAGNRDLVSADRSKQVAVRASTIVHRFMGLLPNSPGKHDLKHRLSELDKVISTLPPKR